MNNNELSLIEKTLEKKKYPVIKKIEKIQEGISTHNYIVTFNDSRRLLARFFPGRSNDLVTEFNLLRILSLNKIPVPLVDKLFLENANYPFMLMEFIEGDILGEVLLKTKISETKDILRMYLINMRNFNLLNWKKIFPTAKNADLLNDPYFYSKILVNRCYSDAKKYQCYSETETILDWIKVKAQGIETESPCFIHGDYHPFNIIIREGNLITLDWESAEIGDIRYDISFAILTVGVIYGKVVEQELLLGFRDILFNFHDLEFFTVTCAFQRIVKLRSLLNSGVTGKELYLKVFNYFSTRIEEVTGLKFKF